MDPCSYKLYHSDVFDPKDHLTMYFACDCDRAMLEELTMFPKSSFERWRSLGQFTWGSLIDFSTGSMIIHLLAICDYIKSITVLETNDLCIKELERWINKEEEAFDWSHFIEAFPELERDSTKWIEKEETLRKRIKNILKFDLNKPNPMEPNVLEKADCLLSVYLLQHVSKDKEEYCTILAKLSSLIKVGGHLLLIGGLNKSFFKIGEHKFHSLSMDDDFLRKSVVDNGFTIQWFEKAESNVKSSITDHGGGFFLSALKVRE